MGMNTLTLESLFVHADIDDVTNDNDGVILSYTLRDDPAHPEMVLGENLADALEQAQTKVNRAITLKRLHDEGLTDDDIDRLSDEPTDIIDRLMDEADEAWYRGYTAGASDAAELIAEGYPLGAPAVSAPVMAAAGSPVESSTLADLETEAQVNLSGREIPILLALTMPGRIVID